MSQTEFAALLNIKAPTVRAWEQGHNVPRERPPASRSSLFLRGQGLSTWDVCEKPIYAPLVQEVRLDLAHVLRHAEFREIAKIETSSVDPFVKRVE